MRLHYSGRNSKLKSAIRKANEILENPSFYEKIGSRESFDNTTLSPSEIAVRIEEWEHPVQIRTYWNPFGTANAKTGNSKYFTVNTAKLKRSKKSIVNTLVHEYVHAVDFGEDGKLEFTHVDNDNRHGDEDDTAPWAIGEIAKQMV